MEYNKTKKTILTDRLYLRIFEESDAETVQVLCNNINIYKSTLYLPFPYSLNDALGWMKNHQKNFEEDCSYEFAITDRINGNLFGAISLTNNQKFNHGEIAYWIGEEYWGKGYGTEAAKAIIDFAFKEKKLHKVFARYFKSNPASGRIMQKVGMVQEGLLKDQVVKDGKYEDLIYYGIINPYDIRLN
ncbi:GNAT family N-acetyltransferase [Sutcliffiella horikoshii]|uniref:GNAT family N-acetyltransferase n=1 Tax=Sutcliffiella horikoshii TaxID=79883 RepID=UPI0020406436|nr:GNAT family N-acetyltransferase [Sutcliffiella horikoshii]MCM3617676.1 GNAT family N-acetyltransferase [Sutcliffiella horikoshii]